MNDVPLIEKEYGSWADGVISKVRIMEISKECGGEVNTDWWFKKSDVVNDLKKFRKGYFGKSVEYLFDSPYECNKCKECAYVLFVVNNKIYCKSCWFKECFGKLPEEVEDVKQE